jgi:hypothetical protein
VQLSRYMKKKKNMMEENRTEEKGKDVVNRKMA